MIHQPLVINLNRIGYLKGNIVIYWNSPYSFIKCSCTNKVVGWCCVLIVDYLINQILSFVLNNQEHHSLLFSKDPPPLYYSSFFCSTCFVHNLFPSPDRLCAHPITCIFLRCSRVQKGYRCCSPSTHRFYMSKDVNFLEGVVVGSSY